MAHKFYAQKIFDSKMECIGVELLVRDVPYGEGITRGPCHILEQPEFGNKSMYALDVQLLTYLDLFSCRFKESGIQYVFINISDQMLKSIILGDDTSHPFSSLLSLSKALHPVKIVVEVSELSRIRREHLALILERLKGAGLKVAQDDYTPFRETYLGIGWDFVKVDLSECSASDIPCGVPVIIERSCEEVMKNHCDHPLVMHQGFGFHVPACVQVVLAEFCSTNAEGGDLVSPPSLVR